MTKTIKKCTTADLATLQKLSIETYTDTFGEFNTPENLQAYLNEAYNDKILTNELANPNSEFYFVYIDENLAGYLKINTLDAQSEKMPDNFLEIQRIYIRKLYKRQVRNCWNLV